MPRPINKALTHLPSDRRGIAAIEFAMIASLTAILVLGAYDFGNAAQQQIQLQEVVRSGGAYAMNHATDVSGIQSVVTNALPSGWILTNSGGVAAIACSCLDASTGNVTSLAGCSATNFDTCASGSGIIVSITATMAYTSVDPVFAAAIPQLSATYVTRFQ
jgi:Flp pilus assembly protein TadG